jgi:hypothetical protein
MTLTSLFGGGSVEAGVHKSPINRDWNEFYKAALFEDDTTKLLHRISEAEKALTARALELFDTGGEQIREQKALDNAWYFLRLLRKIEGGANSPCEPLRPLHANQLSNQHECV